MVACMFSKFNKFTSRSVISFVTILVFPTTAPIQCPLVQTLKASYAIVGEEDVS